MQNTNFLSASVEASRLRRIEADEDYFSSAAAARRHAAEADAAMQSWAPALVCRHVSASWFAVVIAEPGRCFSEAFNLPQCPAFESVQVLAPACALVRLRPPAPASVAAAERLVAEHVAISFMPF